MMSKYKIKETSTGFSVWILTDFGNGYAWEPSGHRFETEEDAQNYIEELKEGEKHDSK